VIRFIQLFPAAVVAALVATSPAAALDRYISQGPGQLVIAGYDTTSYLKKGRPVRGSSAHSVRWQGVTWRFKTAGEAAAFRANPTAFAPQFGAYCTGGLSQQHAVDGQPTIWRQHKGKVYLFATQNGARRFDRNPDGVIRAAAAYWKTLPIK
jgi:YHS domain-containing protein